MTVRPARFPAALAALAVAAFLAGCAGTEPPSDGAAAQSSAGAAEGTATTPTTSAVTAEPRRIEVQVDGGEVSGDVGRVLVPAGEQVTLAITSDVADEVHVHGYDLTTELVPGESSELTFAATIPGVFEVELHDAGTVLLTLQIQ